MFFPWTCVKVNMWLFSSSLCGVHRTGSNLCITSSRMKNHQSERASFLYIHGHFLIDSDPRHVRRSNSWPSTRISITSLPDLDTFALSGKARKITPLNAVEHSQKCRIFHGWNGANVCISGRILCAIWSDIRLWVSSEGTLHLTSIFPSPENFLWVRSLRAQFDHKTRVELP